jgi:hypothetical protein
MKHKCFELIFCHQKNFKMALMKIYFLNHKKNYLLMINLFELLFYMMKVYYCFKVVMMFNLLINLGKFETHQRPQAFLSLTPSVKGDID